MFCIFSTKSAKMGKKVEWKSVNQEFTEVWRDRCWMRQALPMILSMGVASLFLGTTPSDCATPDASGVTRA